jgi:flagellin
MSSSNTLQEAMERLSTGKKINSAADDAAGFAIAESMTAQIRGLSMAAKNASDGLGLLKVIENATNDVTDILQRVRELAVQAQSGTNGTTDVGFLQKEANALFAEIDRISEDTTYNNTAYLGASAGNVAIQVGYNDGDTITITTQNVTSAQLGSSSTKLSDGASTPAYLQINSTTALATISAAIDQVAGYKADWGAGQNRLEYTVSNLMNVVEFTSAARSRIQDADFALEAAKLSKAQVLQQSGAAMLAQANAAPQLALQLLK